MVVPSYQQIHNKENKEIELTINDDHEFQDEI